MNITELKNALKNAGLDVVVFGPSEYDGKVGRHLLVDGLGAHAFHRGAAVTRFTFDDGESVELSGLSPQAAAFEIAGMIGRMHAVNRRAR